MNGLKVNGVTYEMGGNKPVTLWENSSPSSTFAAQTVTLSDEVSNYDFIGVICAVGNGSADNRRRFLPMAFFPVLDSMGAFFTFGTYRNYRRSMNPLTGKSATFTACEYYASYGSSDSTPANGYIIPRYILGFKY